MVLIFYETYMSIIHFHLNEAQETILHQFMKKEGFTNKSEFFRFLMKFYEYHQPASPHQSAPLSPVTNDHEALIDHQSNRVSHVDDSHLSLKKQKLLNDPHIFDEEIRQLIREMKD